MGCLPNLPEKYGQQEAISVRKLHAKFYCDLPSRE
jgi:hypothetical protein